MAGRIAIIRTRLALLNLLGQAVVVCALVSAVALPVGAVAYQISGAKGLLAAGVGAGVNLIGAELALGVSAMFRGPASALHSLAVAMFARTFLPLIVGVILHLRVPVLAASGMIFYLLLFYIVTLLAETALALAHLRADRPSART